MRIRLRATGALVAAAMTVAGTGAATRAEDQTLRAALEQLRESAEVPAVAGATFRSDGVGEIAAVGVRRIGDSAGVTTNDVWHIGSLTKSFTATLAALLVERGQLAWSATLADLFGAPRAGKFGAVTLTNLLTHRAGLPANLPPALMLGLRQSSAPLPQQRQQVVDAALAGEPASAPGERYLYSNVGFVIAGAIVEMRTKQAWEDVLRAEVLKPLGLDSAGFGPPGPADTLSQPRGHRAGANGSLIAVEPGPFADNPAFLGPAGTLHMTIGDLTRWGQAHLKGERGRDGLLPFASFRRLHLPPRPDGDYAYGWVVRDVGGRRVIWHNGSNTMWYAIVAFDPAADRGVAVATNGGIGSAKAVDAAAMRLLGVEPKGTGEKPPVQPQGPSRRAR